MLASQAPACRGSAPPIVRILLGCLASLAAGSGALASPPPGEATPVGAPAPALSLPSLDHGMQDLAALRGKVVLVHFFATWCEPCRDETAALARLARRLEDRPFALLAVDVGEGEVRVRRFFEAEPMPFPVLLDDDRAAMKAWKVSLYPTSVVLGPEHDVRFSVAGPVDWDASAATAALESLLDPAEAAAPGPQPSLELRSRP